MGLYDRDYMRSDDSGGFRRVTATPWSPTIALLVVLIAIFLLQMLLQMRGSFWFERNFALSLEGILHGHIWQLLTFQFLHGGIWHIALNGITLYSFGRVMERTIGYNRFLTLYFLAGTLGGILQIVATFVLRQPAYGLVVGASAGIAGVVGAFAMMYPHQGIILFPIPMPIKARTILWVAVGLSVVGTIIPFGGVAHAAHLGGLLGGIAFVKYLRRGPRSWQQPAPRRTPPIINVSSPPSRPTEPADFITSEVDPILDKIATQGIHSLTERERKILETARSRMGKP